MSPPVGLRCWLLPQLGAPQPAQTALPTLVTDVKPVKLAKAVRLDTVMGVQLAQPVFCRLKLNLENDPTGASVAVARAVVGPVAVAVASASATGVTSCSVFRLAVRVKAAAASSFLRPSAETSYCGRGRQACQ